MTWINRLIHMDFFNNVFINIFEVSVLVEWNFNSGNEIVSIIKNIFICVFKMNEIPMGLKRCLWGELFL